MSAAAEGAPAVGQRRTDNMPAKLTSHAVRGLCSCRYCKGLGMRDLMMQFEGIGDSEQFYIHTSCYAQWHPDTLHQLTPSNLSKLRVCDLQQLTAKQLNAVLKVIA